MGNVLFQQAKPAEDFSPEPEQVQPEAISKHHGFDDVKSAEAAYKAAKAKLKSLKETLGDTEKEEFKIKPKTQKRRLVH